MSSPLEQLQTIARLAPLADVCRRLDSIVAPTVATEVDIAEAECLVPATDVRAPKAAPHALVALRDGWAIRADLLSDASAYAPVLLMPTPEWIETGQIVPAGADAVLAPDDVTMDASAMHAVAAPVAGDGVMPAGADFAKHQVLRRAGAQLRAVDVAVLRAAGISRVSVRRPRVCIVRGNPRVDPNADIVTPLIARAVGSEGGDAHQAMRASADDLANALAAESADAVIAVGGTGLGRGDQSVRTLARIGRLEFHGIGISPGETAAFGMAGTRPVLLLPGRLDAALAAWLLLGRRMLARLTGLGQDESGIALPLARKVVSTIGLAAAVPVRRTAAGLEPLASGTIPLQALAQADGWILVPPESEGYPAGATVTLRPLP